MKKQFVSIFLSLLLVVAMFPGAAIAASGDTPSSWAAAAVSRADSLGLTPSNLNSNFTQNITRAEFCALAVPVYEKITGTPIAELRDFTDTTDINVKKIGGLNVVSGLGNGAFNPNDEITRQEAAVILVNLMSALGESLPAFEPTFADNAQIDTWAREAVGSVQQAGIMAGTGNNNFTPKGDAGRYTREQSIVTLLRVWDMVEKAEPSEDTDTSDTTAVKTDEPTVTSENNGNKVLVAYFSATNTTKPLAEYVADGLSAALYEIVPEKPYTSADLNYNDNNCRSSIEMNNPASRPGISGSVENMEQYDIVFISYPIWWGEAPQIISTFLESYDFSGKTIVPFCTSGSSDIGSTAKLQELTDGAKWLSGRRFSGGTSRDEMIKWVNSLDLNIIAN